MCSLKYKVRGNVTPAQTLPLVKTVHVAGHNHRHLRAGTTASGPVITEQHSSGLRGAPRSVPTADRSVKVTVIRGVDRVVQRIFSPTRY